MTQIMQSCTKQLLDLRHRKTILLLCGHLSGAFNLVHIEDG